MLDTLRNPDSTSLFSSLGVGFALCVGLAACDVGPSGTGTLFRNTDNSPRCATLDFDGLPIGEGRSVEFAYEDEGIHIETFQHRDFDKPGLGVLFDSNEPTGGDDDLRYTDQDFILVAHEDPTQAEITAAFVDDPDDDACGAAFQFTFDQPMCVHKATLLDIERSEREKTKIKLLDEDFDRIATFDVDDPAGDNGKNVVRTRSGGRPTCGVHYMLIFLEGSGAVDDIVLCPDHGPNTPPCEDSFDDEDDDDRSGDDN